MKITDANELAKNSAFEYGSRYSYVPIGAQEKEEWKPHGWVLIAIMEAYAKGLRDRSVQELGKDGTFGF